MKRAAGILRITWDEAWHLMQRAVIRGRAAKGAKLPTHLGVDEKAIAKGHRYMTLVCDLQAATVQYIGEDRKEESLTTYFAAFDQEQRGRIEAISLDTWPAYINACTAQVPEAEDKMVFDRFHIMQHVGQGVDRVRAGGHSLRAQAAAATGDLSAFTAGITSRAKSSMFLRVRSAGIGSP